ncbi:MAG: cysteine desulfurase family protein [Myxococcaceae bacterium]
MIYLDHNATTPLWPQVGELLAGAHRAAVAAPGNPSSVHRAGRDARARVDQARARVAKVLGCEPREVCFTGSGSEADALAVKGAFAARKEPSRTRVVASAIEHHAILGALKHLEAEGATVVRVPPGADGQVTAEAMLAELTPQTALCSLMWANNETGVVQPVAEVARACRARGILFHTDAVQAVGKVPVSLIGCDADLLSLSAHKLGGPAGVGALVVRRGVPLRSLVPGHHEDGRRGGTHNVPYLEALALSLELATGRLGQESERVSGLRDRLEREVRERIAGVTVNGAGSPRVPNTASLTFAGADGEALLIALDLEGICVSAGAACASGSVTPSHVLTAMGLSTAQAHGSLRLSLGVSTTEAEIDRVISALIAQVPRAREAAASCA